MSSGPRGHGHDQCPVDFTSFPPIKLTVIEALREPQRPGEKSDRRTFVNERGA